jgi:multidrug efflux pump subunit AcrA (membrane-fusion protein)
MIAIDVILARLFGSRTILPFAAACLIAQPVPAQQQAAPEMLQYKGTVTAALEGGVAPRLDGLLSKINFKAGQLVNKGDVLFEFATRDKELTLALAQASQKQAEAQLRLAEVNLRNKQTLRTRNAASDMAFLEAEAQRDIAAAKADEARAMCNSPRWRCSR